MKFRRFEGGGSWSVFLRRGKGRYSINFFHGMFFWGEEVSCFSGGDFVIFLGGGISCFSGGGNFNFLIFWGGKLHHCKLHYIVMFLFLFFLGGEFQILGGETSPPGDA